MKVVREFAMEEYVLERQVENGFKIKRERKTYLIYYLEDVKKQIELWNEDPNTVEIILYKRVANMEEIKWDSLF